MTAVEDRTHGLGPARARVLALLQETGEALAAAEVGERLGVPTNSARFHLDGLADAGHVLRTPEERPRRGRPRMLYAAGHGAPDVTGRSYRMLAQMLAGVVHDRVPDPSPAAEEVGRRMAASLPEGTGEDLDAVLARVDTVGFDSRLVESGDPRLEIGHCPFLDVADAHRDVVCALHLGLLRGVLEQAGSPARVSELQPLVEPGRCVALLSR